MTASVAATPTLNEVACRATDAGERASLPVVAPLTPPNGDLTDLQALHGWRNVSIIQRTTPLALRAKCASMIF
jgi:hypothetical protein